jgi:hypothetical protein
LIERGYAPIPIIPGTKKPGFFNGCEWVGLVAWQTRFNKRTPTKQQLAIWSTREAGIGVIGGPASRGMVGFDIDTDEPMIRAALDEILPASPVRKIGRRGETLFYFAPHIAKSRKWLIAKQVICELIGPNKQTVLPPTIHPDTGEPYRWTGLEELNAINPDELPQLAEDFVERVSGLLVPFGYRAETISDRADDEDDSPHRQLNNAALANLGAWVPALPLYRCRKYARGYEAVPIWRPSSSGKSDDERARNLKISSLGIRDFGANQGYTPLDLVMRVLNCDLDSAFGFLAGRLGWADSVAIDVEPPKELEPAPGLDPATLAPPPDPDPLLPFTNVPGIVGEIVEHIVATARRPNRVLALGAAIAVAGTLIGRRVAGPTRSATHLYVVDIAGTGGGKQHILDCAIALLEAAGASEHVGPSKFFSLSAVIELLSHKPLSLCIQDEIAVFLKAVTSKRASSHEAAVSQILRALWGISFATMPTPAWADKPMRLITCPALSVLGVSTPDEFYSALQGDSVTNGFLNRYLVLQSGARAIDVEPLRVPEVPAGLRDALKALYLWLGPQSLIAIGEPEARYRPDVLPWAGTEAAATYADFVHWVDRRMDDDPVVKPYVARSAEMAIRLATIRAAGRWGPGVAVGSDDITWAAELVRIAGDMTLDAVIDRMPIETERGQFAEKLLEIVRRRKIVKPRDIQQAIKGKLRSAEIKDILSQLVEAGLVAKMADGSYQAV